MTATLVQLNSNINSCYKGPSCILLEEGKVFIAHPYSSSYYLYGTIYFGEKVKSYESNILGVAASSGSDGDIIDVVVPNTTT